jgi:dUTP pyrophosphatase
MPRLPIEVRWKRFHPLAVEPTFAHESDSGADMRYWDDVTGVTMFPGETSKLHLGVGVRLPVGYELQLRPRSSMSAKGILCHLGTCDESFVGQLAAVLTNLTRDPIVIQRGDKICQAVIVQRAIGVRFTEADDLGVTERNSNGWGSTGK